MASLVPEFRKMRSATAEWMSVGLLCTRNPLTRLARNNDFEFLRRKAINETLGPFILLLILKEAKIEQKRNLLLVIFFYLLNEIETYM